MASVRRFYDSNNNKIITSLIYYYCLMNIFTFDRRRRKILDAVEDFQNSVYINSVAEATNFKFKTSKFTIGHIC